MKTLYIHRTNIHSFKLLAAAALISFALLFTACAAPAKTDNASVKPVISADNDQAEASFPQPEASLSELPEEPEDLLPTEVEIGGVSIPIEAEEADLSGVDLSLIPSAELDEAFASLLSLKKLTLIDCGLDNAGYAALQDAHPDIRMIWEIQMSHWTVRTDVVAFSSMKTTGDDFFLNNDEAKYFRYCPDLQALDLGHNWVSDLSFLEYLPQLKILILVDNVKYKEEDGRLRHLTDVSEIRYCPELVYLEIFANNISDLSFLEYTPKLRDLNISYNPVKDASLLYKLPDLERLWMEHTYISWNDFSALKKTYPNAKIVFEGEGSVDQGWRGVEKYYALRDCFDNNYINPMFLSGDD